MVPEDWGQQASQSGLQFTPSSQTNYVFKLTASLTRIRFMLFCKFPGRI